MIKIIVMLLLLGVNPTFSAVENKVLLDEAMKDVYEICSDEMDITMVSGTVRNVTYYEYNDKKYIVFTVNAIDGETDDREVVESVVYYDPEIKRCIGCDVKH